MKAILTITDRLVYAARVAAGKRTLDIGGRGMPPSPECERAWKAERSKVQNGVDNSRFAKALRAIGEGASEYRIVDQWEGDYILDLNFSESISRLRGIISDYRPEVIICMETLEHCNYHFEAMQEMARSIGENDSEVFITIPNNGNWIFNRLGWNFDHCVSFLPETARNFIQRSDLGKYDVTYVPCFQQWAWYWRIVYAGGFFQPFSLGFHIRNAQANEPSSPTAGGGSGGAQPKGTK